MVATAKRAFVVMARRMFAPLGAAGVNKRDERPHPSAYPGAHR
jgi:hypothetical protein